MKPENLTPEEREAWQKFFKETVDRHFQERFDQAIREGESPQE